MGEAGGSETPSSGLASATGLLLVRICSAFMNTGRTSARARTAVASRCTLPASSAAPADLSCSLSRSDASLEALLPT